ncbi:hypothetical protein CS0771_23020 [Catellatospora sp. IY07-71]|uniref:hypothetical protein n=1 Tax=Catellatospora sp. IY07-71 TaxID=2728827 RepID=UPI001BB446CF|nr:hypothetical protein [Catellatospora sp. IY07-71]BCJ72758.1 hypothetical protein CS0771_23020 [Catellatospora sp. IY07-71]
MADPQAPVDDPSTGAAASAPETVISLDRDPHADTAPAPARRRPLALILASVVAVVLLLGVGAYAVYRFAFGDGRRAEELTPASAALFVSIDLDTGLEQQLKLFRLAQKAPQGGDGAAQRDEALGELLKSLGLDGVDVDRDLMSWLGRRAGVALWMDGGKPYLLITAASTDSGKAGTGLTRVRDGVDEGTSMGFVARDGVVLIALGEKDGQRAADRAFAEAQRTPLADAASFAADRGWLEGDQLAVVWADLPRYQEATTALMTAGLTDAEEELLGDAPKAQGRLIAGVRATEHGLEARYRTFGAQNPAPALRDAVARLGALPGDAHVGLVAQLPQGLATQASAPTSPYQALLGLALTQAMFSGPDAMHLGEEADLSELPELETPPSGGPEPLEPDLTEAEQRELEALLSKGVDKLTAAERKRAEKLMGLPAGTLADLGELGGPTGTGSMTDPLGMFAAFDGTTVSVAARFGEGGEPAARITAEARDAAGAKKIADLFGEFTNPAGGKAGGLTTSTSGNVVTAGTAGYTAGTGTLAERPAFQQATAGAPAATDVALYVDLAQLLPKDQRDRLPFEALAVLQGTEGGDQTGVIRLIMR